MVTTLPLTEPPSLEARTLRLLYVEDNPRDVELLTSILKHAGYRLKLDLVDEPRVFGQHLEEGDYDIIICDFKIHNGTAMDVLDILRESGKDIPAIVVSGSLGDEPAV